MNEQNGLTLKEILYWVIDNCEDKNAMDKINRATFPFTTKYKDWTEKRIEN